MADPFTVAKLIYAGSAVVLLFYGVYFTITLICLHYFLTRKRRRNWIMISYTVITLILTTIFLAASTKYVELNLLESAINPTGIAELVSQLDLLQQVVYSLKVWLADGLLLYRLWIIWSNGPHILIAPLVLFAGSFASGIAGLALFGQTQHQLAIIHLGVVFHSCSVAINVLATSLIAGRLLYHRRLIQNLSGSFLEHLRGQSEQYLSLLAVFVESGALYTTVDLIYIPLYAANSSFISVWAAVVEAASGIRPSFIVLRVALGVAVGPEVRSTVPGSIHFTHSSRSKHTMELGALSSAGHGTGQDSSLQPKCGNGDDRERSENMLKV